jgi:alanine dehydrogenase
MSRTEGLIPMRPLTVGLPKMHKEHGERRDFLPSLVAFLEEAGASAVVLEEDYGSGVGVSPDEYRSASGLVRFGTLEEAQDQDVVVVLRCPDEGSIRRMRPGSVLVSMLHLEARPERLQLLKRVGTHGVSLDAIVDESGSRLVENLEAVGWNGVREAFGTMARLHKDFNHPSRRPLHVTCLGAGRVAGNAIYAATRYGDPALREEMVARNVPGVEVTVADFDLTWHEDYMLQRLERTDLLIDATQRRDVTRPVVPNAWVAALPNDAVLLDLSADPYDFSAEPPRTKGIEGIPHGDLDQWLFHADDPAWDALDPRVPTVNRRAALSCYSWPGLQPRACMERYGAQLEPVLGLVLAKSVEDWDPDHGSHLERAIARAETSRLPRARELIPA